MTGVQIPPKGPNPVTTITKPTSTECNFSLAYNSSSTNNKQKCKSIIKDKILILLPNEETILNTKRVTTAVQHAVSDSGATGNVLVKGAPDKNKQIARNPIRIKLPNTRYIQSTYTCNLDIPWLPDTMSEAHIVPGLAHSSLISTGKCCDSVCTVFLTNMNADFI